MFIDQTNPAVEVENDNTPLENNQPEQKAGQYEDSELEVDPSLLEEEQEPTQEELEEAEFEGKKYKIPKEIKGALLRQSDYTKKTQEVAEIRKRVEAEQLEFKRTVETQREEFRAYTAIHGLEERIREYEAALNSPEWNDVIDSDQARAIRAEREYRQLIEQRNQRVQEISHKEQERSLKQQQEFAKLEEETRSVLQRDIKGWGVELENSLTEYAIANGANDKGIKQALKYDPVAIKLLNKARLYDQLVKKSLSKPKVEITPLPKVQSGKSVITKDPNQMSQTEYSKWRRERIKNN